MLKTLALDEPPVWFGGGDTDSSEGLGGNLDGEPGGPSVSDPSTDTTSTSTSDVTPEEALNLERIAESVTTSDVAEGLEGELSIEDQIHAIEAQMEEQDAINATDTKVTDPNSDSNTTTDTNTSSSAHTDVTTTDDSNTNLTRVGRWMSNEEYQKMAETGKVQPGGGGITYAAYTPEGYIKQAAPGSLYVEFDVPASTFRETNQEPGWIRFCRLILLKEGLHLERGLLFLSYLMR